MYDRDDRAVDPAADLEWLLQSDQAPPEIILEGLVQEFYPAVYHLAVSILDSRRAARTLAADILARAVIERHSYRSQAGVKNWLFRIALDASFDERRRLQARRSLHLALPAAQKDNDLGDSQPATALDADIWLALDALDEPRRAAMLLHILHGWTLPELVSLLDTPENEVQETLETARRRIREDIQPPLDKTADNLDELLRASLHRRWKRRVFTPEQLDEITRRISRQALEQGRRRRTIVSLVEVGVILLVIVFVAGFFWGAERLFPEPGPTPTPTQQVVTIIRRVNPPQPSRTPPPTQTPDFLPEETYQTAVSGDTWESIAARMGTSAEVLKSFNRIPSGVTPVAGTRLLDPGEWIHLFPGAMLPESRDPLTRTLTLTEALDMQPRYSTLWLDGLAIDYGPAAYVGPPRATRVQLWQARGRTLVLAGRSDEALPELARLTNNGSEWIAHPDPRMPWVWLWEPSEHDMTMASGFASSLLYSLVERGNLTVQDDLQAIGREQVAGIRALEVLHAGDEFQSPSRFWVDDRTGLVLQQIFYYQDSETPFFESKINRVVYNAPHPGELLTEAIPWRGSYALDVSGAPEALGEGALQPRGRRRPRPGPMPVPDDFDPGQYRLTFYYPASYTGTGLSMDVELFAGIYNLSKVTMGDPWAMVCDRSPDGRSLAFVSDPNSLPGSPEARLHYLSVDPSAALQSFSMGGPNGMQEPVFSPDSRKLAYFMRSTAGSPGNLAVLDLDTREITRFFKAWDVRSLVWSPDGERLAMIAHLDETGYEHVVVVDASGDSGITYSAAIDIQGNRDQRDWPMLDWGVEFPVDRGGMDDCAQPPETQIP